MKASTVATLSAFLPQVEWVQLTGDEPEVDTLVGAYLKKYNLEARSRATERAQIWRGAVYHGKIIAVFGERWTGNTLEITDAYQDETPEGTAALMSTLYGYLKLAQSGRFTLTHAVLYENKDMWTKVVQESGDMPYALIFRHEKKGAP